MISIIVPVYKVEKYLNKCIESILAQTYKDFELILVDDGSPDNSGKICDEYAKKDSRIKVIHQLNAGQSRARNKGLENATGDYITFVDSDDFIESYMLEMLVEMMQQECDIAICGHRTVKEGDVVFRNPEIKTTERLNREALWEEIFGNLNNAVWNKLYKRELLKDIYFPTDLYHGEDLIFNLNYLCKCRDGAINRTSCYNYLKREDSITTSNFSDRKLMEIESKDRALGIVSRNNESQVENAKKYCFRARMNVMRAIVKADKENSYKEIIAACREYTKKNYRLVKSTLRYKEKVEWYFSDKLFVIYRIIVKKVW